MNKIDLNLTAYLKQLEKDLIDNNILISIDEIESINNFFEMKVFKTDNNHFIKFILIEWEFLWKIKNLLKNKNYVIFYRTNFILQILENNKTEKIFIWENVADLYYQLYNFIKKC